MINNLILSLLNYDIVDNLSDANKNAKRIGDIASFEDYTSKFHELVLWNNKFEANEIKKIHHDEL